MRPERTKVGIGWRPQIADVIAGNLDKIDFVEIVAENFMNMPALPPALYRLREEGIEIHLHCISLSPGGAAKPDLNRLAKIRKLADAIEAKTVSDHVCFVRARGLESGHLLPVPRTNLSMRVMVDNVLLIEEMLGRPLALENIASICEWPGGELEEAEFIAELLEKTDTSLLLDLANVYANSLNHRFDAMKYLAGLPLKRLAYVHMAGGIMRDGFYHDTHAHPVAEPVFNLLKNLRRTGLVPGVMLERDDRFPPGHELILELQRLSDTVRQEAAPALAERSYGR